MLDVALTVTSWKQLSLFGLAGIGFAKNRVSYSDSPNGSAPCTDQPVRLSSKNNNNFVWEAGAGLDFAFNSNFSLFFEYLYTDLGKVKPSGSGSAGTITSPVLSAPQFHVKAQTALLGIKIGF